MIRFIIQFWCWLCIQYIFWEGSIDVKKASKNKWSYKLKTKSEYHDEKRFLWWHLTNTSKMKNYNLDEGLVSETKTQQKCNFFCSFKMFMNARSWSKRSTFMNVFNLCFYFMKFNQSLILCHCRVDEIKFKISPHSTSLNWH
jgi:hypothetical protein